MYSCIANKMVFAVSLFSSSLSFQSKIVWDMNNHKHISFKDVCKKEYIWLWLNLAKIWFSPYNSDNIECCNDHRVHSMFTLKFISFNKDTNKRTSEIIAFYWQFQSLSFKLKFICCSLFFRRVNENEIRNKSRLLQFLL